MSASRQSGPSHATHPTQPECWCNGLGARYPLYDEFGLLVGYREVCHCPVGQRMKAEAEKNAASSQARRIARYLALSDIPERFRQFSLDNCPHRRLVTRMKDAAPDSSWVLWGPPGRGKTALAIAYLRHWIERNTRRAQFVSMPKLLSHLRGSYDGEYTEISVIEHYCRLGLLVLDDVGAESVGSDAWFTDRLYQIIGRRHDELRPVVLTSNLSPEQLARRVGERIWWRVLEMCGADQIVHVAGPNLRMRGSAQEAMQGCVTHSSTN